MASKTASPTTTQQRKAAENVDNSLTKVGNTPLTSTTQLNAVGQSPTSFVNEAYDYYDQQVEQLPG
jgi:hypothetical protein